MALLGNIFSLVEYHAGSILCHGKPLAKCLRRKSKQPVVAVYSTDLYIPQSAFYPVRSSASYFLKKYFNNIFYIFSDTSLKFIISGFFPYDFIYHFSIPLTDLTFPVKFPLTDDVFMDLGNWPFKNLPFYLVTFMGGIHL